MTPDETKSAPPERDPLRDAAGAALGHPRPRQTGILREWADALVIAFVLAMFIRTFGFELFKIPSGSMSPTLLGDFVAEGQATDDAGEPHTYLLIFDNEHQLVQRYRKDRNGVWLYEGRVPRTRLSPGQGDLLRRNIHKEEHQILVNKFAYWFSPPDRGDIVVFRVPFPPEGGIYERNNHVFPVPAYDRSKAVYVKRAVALGGETVSLDDEGRLVIDGELVESPSIFRELRYVVNDKTYDLEVEVPKREVYMFGDNSDNSTDSRFWGGVPYENLRGKAFFRLRPFKKAGFLKSPE